MGSAFENLREVLKFHDSDERAAFVAAIAAAAALSGYGFRCTVVRGAPHTFHVVPVGTAIEPMDHDVAMNRAQILADHTRRTHYVCASTKGVVVTDERPIGDFKKVFPL